MSRTDCILALLPSEGTLTNAMFVDIYVEFLNVALYKEKDIKKAQVNEIHCKFNLHSEYFIILTAVFSLFFFFSYFPFYILIPFTHFNNKSHSTSNFNLN